MSSRHAHDPWRRVQDGLDLSQALAQLSDVERLIVRRLMIGDTQTQVAQALQVHQSTISRRISEIGRKFVLYLT